jgi:hypothetical protein
MKPNPKVNTPNTPPMAISDKPASKPIIAPIIDNQYATVGWF